VAVAGATENRKRREAAAAARRREAEAQRKRRMAVVAGWVLAALVLLSVPVYLLVRGVPASADLETLGVAASEAGCSPVTKSPATGEQQHVADGTAIPYDQAPPAYGPHYATSAPFGRTFYTPSGRPPLGHLVHNLEHGYTILWYDDSVAADGADTGVLQAIADRFAPTAGFDPTKKFIVAPYTANDPGSFPPGKRLALTHWYANVEQGAAALDQQGITQYCERVSGEVVAEFVKAYPYTDSPEPSGG
jgi:hypothetical protein